MVEENKLKMWLILKDFQKSNFVAMSLTMHDLMLIPWGKALDPLD